MDIVSGEMCKCSLLYPAKSTRQQRDLAHQVLSRALLLVRGEISKRNEELAEPALLCGVKI